MLNNEWSNQIDTFNLWYLKKTSLKYRWLPKDFQHLKLLLRELLLNDITFESYLDLVPDGWYTDNASIPLLNSHFNQIMRSKQKSNGFPDYYSQKFEKTLENNQLTLYWQHLTKLGYVNIYSQGSGSTWSKSVDK